MACSTSHGIYYLIKSFYVLIQRSPQPLTEGSLVTTTAGSVPQNLAYPKSQMVCHAKSPTPRRWHRLPRPNLCPGTACRRRCRRGTVRKQRRVFRAQGIPDLALGCCRVLLDGLLCIGRVLLSFLVFLLGCLDEENGPGLFCGVHVSG